MTTRETCVENVKLELDERNDQLHSFEAKVTRARQDARQRYVTDLARPRAPSRVTQAKWQEQQASIEVAWHQHVTGMDHVREAFIHAFHEFSASP